MKHEQQNKLVEKAKDWASLERAIREVATTS